MFSDIMKTLVLLLCVGLVACSPTTDLNGQISLEELLEGQTSEALKRSTDSCGSSLSYLSLVYQSAWLSQINLRRSTLWQETTNPLNDLLWDNNLAQRAADHAATCPLGKGSTTDCDGNEIGQNIYVDTYNSSNSISFSCLASSVVSEWWSQSVGYSYSANNCSSFYCGDYLQLAWRNTTHVGCAIDVCDGTYPSGQDKRLSVVCNFSPKGYNVNESPF